MKRSERPTSYRIVPRVLAGLLLMLAIGPLLGASQGEADFRVVVHSSNPISELSRGEVSQLFLRQVTRWEHGPRVLPVNLADDSPMRRRFAEEINRKSLRAEEAFWQRRIFTGRGVPPVEVDSDDEVLAYVEKHPGAIGYVSSGADTARVKAVVLSEPVSPGGAEP